jgi:hypothetical protein
MRFTSVRRLLQHAAAVLLVMIQLLLLVVVLVLLPLLQPTCALIMRICLARMPAPRQRYSLSPSLQHSNTYVMQTIRD